MHRDMKDLVLAQYPAEMDQVIQQVEAREADVLERFEVIDQRFLGDRRVIAKAKQDFVQWRPIRDEVIALKQTGNTQQAAAITKGRGSAYVSRLMTQINVVEEFAQNKAVTFTQQSHQTQRYLRTVTIILFSTVIGFAFFWTRWLTYLIKQDRLTQRDLTFQARRSEALLELPKYADELNEVAFLQRGQEFAEALTDSTIAFIHFVNDDEQTIELVAWSRATLAHYCHAVADTHYPVEHAGIWADALRQHQPVVINDYAAHQGKKGLPEGHAHLERLISVPVMENGKVVMLTGVGNKPTPYTQQDVETVQLISNELWRIAHSRRLYQQIVASERHYRLAELIAKIGNWELNCETNELYWSPEVFRLFNLSPTAFAPSYEAFLELIHPGDRDAVKTAYQTHLQSHHPYEIIHRVLLPDGRLKYFHQQCSTVHSEDNRPLLSRGTIQDVTELQEAKLDLERLNAELEQKIQDRTRELENSEKRYRFLMDNAADAILLADLDGNLLECNRQASVLLGYSTSELKTMQV